MSLLFEQIQDAVIDGIAREVKELTQKAIDEGNKPEDIINDALVAGMNEVGEMFAEGEMFVPEVLVASKAMNEGMDMVKPLLKGDMETLGTAVFCTVKGDLHDIGQKLVAMMLESSGFKVINLGTDTPPEKIVESVKENDADIVGMSAMLTTTMVAMKETIEALKEEGLYDKLGVMIGGAPVSDSYAKKIGASYSDDATSAVKLAKTLIKDLK